jgi:hypothetical protein
MTKTTILMMGLLAGCVSDELDTEELSYGETEQSIEDGILASSFQWGRAVRLKNCTGTLISPDTVLTALHCRPMVGDNVQFWTSATTFGGLRTVSQVIIPSGTAILPLGQYDYTDSSDNHADIAVLRLSSPVLRATATMAWVYPGSDKIGQKVGNGYHEESITFGTQLRQRSDYTHGNSEDGEFFTNQHGTNNGDSGGPFYVSSKLVGVLTGGKWDLVWRGWHTSVSHHLDFILNAMDYTWSGTTSNNVARTGELISTFFYRSHQICRYACDRTSSCEAYTWMDLGVIRQCNLLSSVTGATSNDNAISGRKD